LFSTSHPEQANITYAVAFFVKDPAAGSRAAWHKSVFKNEGRGACRLADDSPLLRILHSFQAWDGLTSSVVERAFSKTVANIGKSRAQLGDSKRFSEIKVMCDVNDANEQEVIRRARIIWVSHWSAPRSSGTDGRAQHFRAPRTAAAKRQVRIGKFTEASFLRNRRTVVRQRAAANATGLTREQALSAATAASESTWTAKLGAAEEKLIARSKAAKADALVSSDHLLLPTDLDDATVRLANERAKNRVTNDRQADSKKRCAKRRASSRPAVDLSRMPVFVDTNVELPEGHGLQSVQRWDAVLYLANDVSAPSVNTQLAVGMLGGAIVDYTYLSSNGTKGVRVMYDAAVRTFRRVFISEAFRSVQPIFVQTLLQCAAVETSKWKIIGLDEFVKLVDTDSGRPAGKRKPFAVLGVLTNAEKATEPYVSMRNVFDKAGLVKFVSKVQSVVSDTAGM